MTARPSGCDCFDCSGEGASWRLLAISGVGHQAPSRQARHGKARQARVIIMGGAIVHCAPRDWSWLCHLYNELHFWPERELKYNQVEFKKIFILFLIVYLLVCHNNWPKFIVQDVLIQLLVEGVRSNNLFREKRDPNKVSLNCDNSLFPLSALGKTVESQKTPKMY